MLGYLEVKGHFLTFVKSWVLGRWGEEGFRKFLGDLPGDLAEVLAGEPLASTWYPHRYWGEVALGVDSLFGRGDYSLIEEGGRLHARVQMDRIYPLVFGNPRVMLNNLGVIWRLNFRPGWARARLVGASEVYVLFGGFKFERKYWPVWRGTKAFFEEVAVKAGFKGEAEIVEPEPGEDWVVGLRWRWS